MLSTDSLVVEYGKEISVLLAVKAKQSKGENKGAG